MTTRAKAKKQRTETAPSFLDVAERRAYTVAEFCAAMRISKAQYYQMKKDHKGPAEAHAGGRVIISMEAADQWLEDREADAKANAAKHLRRKGSREENAAKQRKALRRAMFLRRI
jgi:hypothetical protein